jgi:soluble lytic murein transglycosylase-like protein
MNTKDLIELKKQRIQEELQKLVPPGFHLFPPPKMRGDSYDKLDKFLGKDTEFLMQVGYLTPTNKGYDTALQHLRFFGGKLKDYKEFENTGPFYNNPELNKNLRECCDYILRFYELAEITIKRINDEEDVRLKLIQKERDKQQKDLEQSQEKKKKASGFVAGATKFRPGKVASIKTAKISSIIPKTRAIPEGLADKISKTSEDISEEPIAVPKKIASTFGRLTLDLVQITDNLDKVREVIVEDYKNTKQINKKEVEEYRKRVSNRSRRIGKRELGDDKTSLKDLIKKYVGGFFTGTGGAIRALALFNMLEAFANGNPMKAIGPLLGIGATYLPAIGQAVGGIIAAKVLGGIFKGGKGVSQGARVGTEVAGKGAKFVPGLAKKGLAGLGIGAGLFAASKILGPQDNTDAQQQRLEDLTQEQKGITDSQNITPIPENDLQRFQNLNKKFEKALDFLLNKQKNQTNAPSGGGTPPPPPILPPPSNPTQLNSGKYKDIINQASQISGLPASQIAAMGKIESTFDPNAISGSGAMGIMQMMPGTFDEQYKKYGKKYNLKDDIKDPQSNIVLGSLYMRDLLNGPAKGSIENMVKMYNAGSAGDLSKPETTNHWKKFKNALKDFANLESGLNGMKISPTKQYPNVTHAPSSSSPVVVPFVSPQNQESSPMSMGDQGNAIINHVSTSYSDNFLTLYSRLIYQIV